MSLNPLRLRHAAKRLLRQLHREERGSILPYTVGGTMVLLLIGLLLITYLGDAYDQRRQASTAADSAALAAAEAWAEALEDHYTQAVLADGEAGLWDDVGQPLGAFAGDAAAAADEYAALNGATVTAVSYDPWHARVTVSVEGDDTVQDTGHRSVSTATAQIVFVDGVCNSGGRLGLMIGGTCRTEPSPVPVAVTTPDPEATAETTPVPFELPDRMAESATTRTRLVAS